MAERADIRYGLQYIQGLMDRKKHSVQPGQEYVDYCASPGAVEKWTGKKDRGNIQADRGERRIGFSKNPSVERLERWGKEKEHKLLEKRIAQSKGLLLELKKTPSKVKFNQELHTSKRQRKNMNESSISRIQREELQECTFRPCLTPRKSSSVKRISGVKPNNYKQENSPLPQKLKEWDDSKNAKLTKKRYQVITKEDEACTFTPKINTRSKKLLDHNSYTPIHKRVDRCLKDRTNSVDRIYKDSKPSFRPTTNGRSKELLKKRSKDLLILEKINKEKDLERQNLEKLENTLPTSTLEGTQSWLLRRIEERALQVQRRKKRALLEASKRSGIDYQNDDHNADEEDQQLSSKELTEEYIKKKFNQEAQKIAFKSRETSRDIIKFYEDPSINFSNCY